MTINLHLPNHNVALRPTITVVGVGGAGGNAVNNMINARLEGVEFVVANTDAQALDSALTERKIQLGMGITKGLGAGADPQVGRAAAEEAIEDIINYMEGSNMVFITAGMGGGTGTGAAPVVARAARELGILTVGVVTKPFQFEGANRMRMAELGLKELQQYVDTLIVIPNQNLFRLATEKTTFADAFRMADEVLHSGVRGVTDLMVKPGLVNLDFADIRTVMREMGKAMMGTGEATGDKRAVEAAEAAISNPLLDDVSLKGAKAALINITGGSDMTLFEVDEAANRIREEVDADANIIFGSTFNSELEGMMRVSVVATGIDSESVTRGSEGEEHAQRRPSGSGASGGNKRPFTYMPAVGISAPQRRASAEPAESAFSRRAPAAMPAAPAAAPAQPKVNVTPASAAPAPAPVPVMREEKMAEPAPSSHHHAEAWVQESYAEEAFGEEAPAEHYAHPEPAMEEMRSVAPAPQPAVAAAPRSQTVEQHESNQGSLFVSPRDARPTPRPQRQPVAAEVEATGEEEGTGGFGFLGKIAEVKRALSSRAPEASSMPQRSSAQVEEKRRPHVNTMGGAYGAEEENLEIPAFLRRQAN